MNQLFQQLFKLFDGLQRFVRKHDQVKTFEEFTNENK